MTSRRRLLSATIGAGAIAAVPALHARERTRTYVLIHGAWHGGWCWQRLAPLLAAAGHRVLAPSLPGLAERAGELSAATNLDVHIGDVVALLSREQLRDVVLVGHSYAGLVITGIADRAAARLAHLVYLDAVIVGSGASWSSTHSRARLLEWARLAKASGGVSVPPPDASAFGISATDRDWVNARLTPHPYGTYVQPLRLTHPFGNGVRRTHIGCSGPGALSAGARRVPVTPAAGWSTYMLDAAHDAMVTRPKQLADLLLSIG